VKTVIVFEVLVMEAVSVSVAVIVWPPPLFSVENHSVVQKSAVKSFLSGRDRAWKTPLL
jgi:hypothetical protein